MKPGSVLSKVTAMSDMSTRPALVESKENFKKVEQLTKLDKSQRKSFFEKMDSKRRQFFEKENQCFAIETDATVKKHGWQAVFTGPGGKCYFNKNHRGAYLMARSAGTFDIYPAGSSFPLFKNDKPIQSGAITDLDTVLLKFNVK